MSKMKFEDKNRKGILQQKGFYAAIVVCLLAMGAGTWTAVNKISPAPIDDNTSYSITSGQYNSEVKGAGKNVSGIPKSTVATSHKKPVTSKNVTTKSIDKVATFFVLPVGSTIVKRYSDKELQFSETYNDWRLHEGIDISSPKGTQVKSAGNGIVKEIKEDPLLGTTVVIDHGNGIVAYYSGLNKVPTVKKDQIIEVGTVIGGIDTIPCECVEQPHLHFAVMKNGKYVSPVDTMKLQP